MSALLRCLAASRRFLAQRFREDDDFNIIPARQPVANSKRCRAGLTINVKFGSHCKSLLSTIDENSTLICTA